MNNETLSEISDQLRPDPQVRARLFEAIDAEPVPAPASRPRGWLAWVAAATAVVLVGLAALQALAPGNRELSAPPPLPAPASLGAIDPADYALSYAAVQRAFAAFPQGAHLGMGSLASTAAQFSGVQFVAQADARTASGKEGTWNTNNQVAGIDEGDVVKSDGRTIYTASGTEVVLVGADGAKRTEVAQIDTTADETGPTVASNAPGATPYLLTAAPDGYTDGQIGEQSCSILSNVFIVINPKLTDSVKLTGEGMEDAVFEGQGIEVPVEGRGSETNEYFDPEDQ